MEFFCLFFPFPCLYADDTQIFASSDDYTVLVDKLNFYQRKISEWLARNKLQHHPTKAKVMIVDSTRNLKKQSLRSSSNAKWKTNSSDRLF